MNPVTQAKVLRVLENRTIERLGGTHSIPVDVRVISATHRNLAAEIRNGRFREDLFYRLRVVTVDLPPLRAHKGDIALLAEAFLEMHAARVGRTLRLSREAPERLPSFTFTQEALRFTVQPLVSETGTWALPPMTGTSTRLRRPRSLR